MRYGTTEEELKQWARRKRAIEEIEGSEGYALILARIKQELDDAESQLERVGRWNWFKIFRLMERRYVAKAIYDYMKFTKEVGTRAENELFKRDPNFKRDERISFVRPS